MLWLVLFIVLVGFIIAEREKILELLKKSYQKVK
jgi:hypothetical protein